MRSTRRWHVVTVFVLLASVAAGCGDDSTTSTSSPTTAATTTEAPATAVPPTTSSTTAVPPATTTAPAAPTTISPWLRQGDRGDDVLALQRRLSDLGYWLGTPDGAFGSNTHHAVVALQKVAGLARDGVVGPATLDALGRGVRPSPQSSAGRVVEIDLAHQVLVAVQGGAVQWVFDTSTGKVPGTTPVGHWTVTRQIDGLRRSELGLLYRPKYFYVGVAIHGYTSVPDSPASHGCVRVTYPAMDAIWALGLAPVGTPVWVR